jgi:hypothetical protein
MRFVISEVWTKQRVGEAKTEEDVYMDLAPEHADALID